MSNPTQPIVNLMYPMCGSYNDIMSNDRFRCLECGYIYNVLPIFKD